MLFVSCWCCSRKQYRRNSSLLVRATFGHRMGSDLAFCPPSPPKQPPEQQLLKILRLPGHGIHTGVAVDLALQDVVV